MGCPCSAKTHPRQSGSASTQSSGGGSTATQRVRIGANRGDRWTGPAKQQQTAPAPAPSE